MIKFESLVNELLNNNLKCPYCKTRLIVSISEETGRHPYNLQCQNPLQFNIFRTGQTDLIRFYGVPDHQYGAFDISANDNCEFNNVADLFKYFELLEFYS